MILTCPSCATSYSVDGAKLGPAGRTVRCAACGERWTAKAEAELELVAPVAVAEPTPEPVAEAAPADDTAAENLPKAFRARAEEAKGLRKAAINGAIWAGMAACLAIVIGAAGFFRVDVVRLVPRASGAYAMVGLPVNPVGLDFEKITAHPALQDGHDALVVSGVIRNIQDRAIAAPPIKISVLDKAGKTVAHKIAASGPAPIAPGETRHFVVTLINPPTTADDVEVAFAALRATPAAAAPKPKAQKPSTEHALRGMQPAPTLHPVEAVEAVPLAPDSPYALHGDEDHG